MEPPVIYKRFGRTMLFYDRLLGCSYINDDGDWEKVDNAPLQVQVCCSLEEHFKEKKDKTMPPPRLNPIGYRRTMFVKNLDESYVFRSTMDFDIKAVNQPEKSIDIDLLDIDGEDPKRVVHFRFFFFDFNKLYEFSTAYQGCLLGREHLNRWNDLVPY